MNVAGPPIEYVVDPTGIANFSDPESTLELIFNGFPRMPDMVGRSTDGIHVSEIVYDLCIKYGYFKPEEYVDTGDSELMDAKPREFVPTARMELGNAMERAVIDRLSEQYPGRFIHIGEVGCDGIYGTLDLFDTELNAVVEIKLTWLSSKHVQQIDGEKMWKYWTQSKSYAHMIRTRKILLIVCFLMGDYKSSGPQFFGWLRTYTPSAIAQNWALIRSRGMDMMKERAARGEALGR